MKSKGYEYVTRGPFVDDMMHIYSCYAMKDEILALYKKGKMYLIFAAPENRRTLRLKRIGEASSQQHIFRLPGAVNQRACLSPSESPGLG